MQTETGLFSFFELFNRGGWVMYVILLVSIYALGVMLFKALQFSRLGVWSDGFFNAAATQISPQGFAQSGMWLPRLNASEHPLARVMEAGLTQANQPNATPEKLREELTRVGAEQLHRLESYTRGLELAATLAPLLGLLGMVLSMIHVFSVIESSGARVDVSLLAGGIWEALLTTAFGLIVAVPAQAAYFFFDQRIEAVRQQINDIGMRMLQMLTPGAAMHAEAPLASPSAPRFKTA